MKLPHFASWPTEFHIHEETYQVRWVSKFPGNDQKLSGLCDGSSHIIYLKKGMSKSQAFRTLTHELLHAIEFEYEIEVPHKLIHQFERGICDLLLSNF